jgi:hypothetical protein
MSVNASHRFLSRGADIPSGRVSGPFRGRSAERRGLPARSHTVLLLRALVRMAERIATAPQGHRHKATALAGAEIRGEVPLQVVIAGAR